MGGAASKPARQFPRTTKPSWAGARTPSANEGPLPGASIPRASEIKNEAIERDSKDPQLLANLSHFRPVKVDHHMQTIRPAAERAQSSFRARQQSEIDAHSSRPVRDRLLAASLADLLEERKLATSPEELEALAEKYDIDFAKLENIARYVTSPSIDEASVVKRIGDDGVERVTMVATWVNPSLRGPPYTVSALLS